MCKRLVEEYITQISNCLNVDITRYSVVKAHLKVRAKGMRKRLKTE
jgi:hypothetical protein